MKPTVGRIVHYCPVTVLYQPRAALIVRIHESGAVRLRGFSPYASDAPEDSASALDEVVDAEFSETPKMGCWSWPPRES